jgi:hypothetical protein
MQWQTDRSIGFAASRKLAIGSTGNYLSGRCVIRFADAVSYFRYKIISSAQNLQRADALQTILLEAIIML